MPEHTHAAGWRRILERAGVPHCGSHAIRHRSATDIAMPSGVPLKVGMALTAHKTVTMFMRYVHAEDDPIRAAAEAVTARRRGLIGASPLTPPPPAAPAPAAQEPDAPVSYEAPLGIEDRAYSSRTKLGNYRPYRARTGPNRQKPPKSGSRAAAAVEADHV